MNKRIFSAAFIFFISVAFASSEIPRTLNFQGRLLKDGAPLNETKQLTFTFWDSATGGNQITGFRETQEVGIEKGVFTALIGYATPAGIPIEIFNGPNLWLQAELVEGANRIVLCRERISSVGYAFKAGVAETVSDAAITTSKIKDKSVTMEKLSAEIFENFVSMSTASTTIVQFILPSTAPVIAASSPDGTITLANDTRIAKNLFIGTSTIKIGTSQTDEEGNEILFLNSQGLITAQNQHLIIRSTGPARNLNLMSYEGDVSISAGTGKRVNINSPIKFNNDAEFVGSMIGSSVKSYSGGQMQVEGERGLKLVTGPFGDIEIGYGGNSRDLYIWNRRLFMGRENAEIISTYPGGSFTIDNSGLGSLNLKTGFAGNVVIGNVAVSTISMTSTNIVAGGELTDKITLKANNIVLDAPNINVSNTGIPRGVIVMWSGTLETIPKGWALCDGTQGTPNLRDRFIVGAGNIYPVNNTGGLDSVTLTVAQIPSHRHSGTTDTAGTHAHNYLGQEAMTRYEGWSGQQHYDRTTTRTTEPAGAHVHTFVTEYIGGGQPHENRPPYYALAFIMKL